MSVSPLLAGTAGCTPASQPKPELEAGDLFLALSLAQKRTWLEGTLKRQAFLDL